ncbi:hypothetical protein AB4Z51_12305 [Bradyrhizobium sp. 2TAF36]|uniref:hypothetical protein n=1 Tax=Bradyrhizobium sp. 2TAF36 TaxID=3233016 RepID=UPI003F9256EB
MQQSKGRIDDPAFFVVNHSIGGHVEIAEHLHGTAAAMNMIVLMTAAGAPLAMLGLSTPDLPQRNCILMIHPQVTSAVFESKEGKIVFPDRPTEYPCSYARKKGGTDIAFTNQNGWRFEVRIGRGDEGSWRASLADEAVSGRAFSPLGDRK